MQKNLSLFFEPLVMTHRIAMSDEFIDSYRAKTKELCDAASENLSSIYGNIRFVYKHVRKSTPNFALISITARLKEEIDSDDPQYSYGNLFLLQFYLLALFSTWLAIGFLLATSIEVIAFLYKKYKNPSHNKADGALSYVLAWASCVPMVLFFTATFVYHALEAVVSLTAYSYSNTFSGKFFASFADSVCAIYNHTHSYLMEIGCTKHTHEEEKTQTDSDKHDTDCSVHSKQAVQHTTKGTAVRKIFATVLSAIFSAFASALMLTYALAVSLIWQPLYLSVTYLGELCSKGLSGSNEPSSEKSSTSMDEICVCVEQSSSQTAPELSI